MSFLVTKVISIFEDHYGAIEKRVEIIQKVKFKSLRFFFFFKIDMICFDEGNGRVVVILDDDFTIFSELECSL